MGVLCSTLDKDGDDSAEGKIRTPNSPQGHHRLRKPYHFGSPGARQQQLARDHMTNFDTMDAYQRALDELQAEEKARAFDARLTASSSDVEKRASDLVQKLRAYDWDHTYGKPFNGTGRRTQGEHFLGNVDLINQTQLMRVAKRMPKGAHLHIHFNSCLPANFLIRQARDIDAMYIRSTLPLTSRQNWTDSRISFMVMTRHEASHTRDANGIESFVGLGDVFDAQYAPNRWMLYKRFQRHFRFRDDVGDVLEGTEGAETWLQRKMEISEDEAHGCRQTGRG